MGSKWWLALAALAAVAIGDAHTVFAQDAQVPRGNWPAAEIAAAGRRSFPTLFGANANAAGAWTNAEIVEYYHRWNSMNHFTGDAARRINLAHGLQETFIFAERVLNEMVADGTITRAQANTIARSGALWRASYATGNTMWDLQGGPGGNASAGARLTPAQETACRDYWRRVIRDEARAPRAGTAAYGFAIAFFAPEIINSIRERLSGRPTDEVDDARSQFYVFAGTLAYAHYRALPAAHQVAIGGAVRGAAVGATRLALPAGLVLTAAGLIPPAIYQARLLAERVERWNETRIIEMNAPPSRAGFIPGGTILANGGRRIKVPFYWQLPAAQRERYGWIVIYGPSVDRVAEGLWRQYVQNVDNNTPAQRQAAFDNLLRILEIAVQPREDPDGRNAPEEETSFCPGPCPSGQAACDDGTGACISDEQVCDGVTDCSGAEDENGCELADYFPCGGGTDECSDGACIPADEACDGVVECGGGEDESGCGAVTCADDEQPCGDGTCVFDENGCDGVVDCASGVDEASCPAPCASGQAACDDGACIAGSSWCDGATDCAGGEDEAACAPCGAGQASCEDGACIAWTSVCNGATDCSAGEDEADCSSCGDAQSTCEDGTCIADSAVCDGVANCAGGEDEGCVNDCSCTGGTQTDIFTNDASTLARFEFNGDAADQSGAGRSGALLGGSFTKTAFGQGLQLAGTYPQGLDWSAYAGLLTYPFTIEVVFEVSQDTGWEKLFSFDDNNDFGWYVFQQGSQWYPNAVDGHTIAPSDGACCPRRHYLVTRATSPSTADLFIDGVFVGNTPLSFLAPPLQAIFFEDDSGTGRREMLNGIVDGLRISNTARSNAEIAAMQARVSSCGDGCAPITCIPQCSGVACGGGDGCGGTCCAGSGCIEPYCGSCQTLDSCGGACITAADGTYCTSSYGSWGVCEGGACACMPQCSYTWCGGGDGCGGTCCAGSGCTEPYCGSCQTLDSCGGACVSIPDGTGCTTWSGAWGSCNGGECLCTPQCSGAMCGSGDGCGGTCCAGSGCTEPYCGSCQTLDSCGGTCVDIWNGFSCGGCSTEPWDGGWAPTGGSGCGAYSYANGSTDGYNMWCWLDTEFANSCDASWRGACDGCDDGCTQWSDGYYGTDPDCVGDAPPPDAGSNSSDMGQGAEAGIDAGSLSLESVSLTSPDPPPAPKGTLGCSIGPTGSFNAALPLALLALCVALRATRAGARRRPY